MDTPQFHRVLVTLDGSDLAERGLEYAVRLARPLGLGLTLLRVATSHEEVGNARGYLQAVATRVRDTGLVVSDETREGQPVHEILAAERDGDLLVMASHGATGLERFVLGTVADRVLRYGRAPLFLARAFRPAASALSPILVPLDGSTYAEAILPYARLFARALDADLKIVRVIYTRVFDALAYPPQITEMTLEWERSQGAGYLEAIVSDLARDGFRAKGSVREAEPFQAICQAAAEDDGGFIAMATRGRSGLARTLLGSVAARVSEEASDPVFLLKV